jgi:hypothetical protein
MESTVTNVCGKTKNDNKYRRNKMRHCFNLKIATPKNENLKEAIYILRRDNEDAKEAFNDFGVSSDFYCWDNFEGDLCEFSGEFPDVIFQLDVLDKDYGKRRFYFCNGKMQECEGTITFEPINKDYLMNKSYTVVLKMGVMNIEFKKAFAKQPKIGDILTFDLKYLLEDDYQYHFEMMEKLGTSIYATGDKIKWVVNEIDGFEIVCIEEKQCTIRNKIYKICCEIAEEKNLNVDPDDYGTDEFPEFLEAFLADVFLELKKK